jgi:hypothetical protein
VWCRLAGSADGRCVVRLVFFTLQHATDISACLILEILQAKAGI